MIQGPPPEFDRITIEEDENQTLITYRWFHWTYLSHLTVGIIALSFIYFVATTDGVPDRRVFAIVALFIALLTGFLSIYVALTGIVNHTRIVVQDRKIHIISGPIPWVRDRPKEVTNIVKINNTEREGRWKFEPFRIYPIVALTANNEVQSVLGHVNSEIEAVYISEKLQQRLGIKSKPYLEVLLDKLYESDTKLNPSFTKTREYQVSPGDMVETIKLTIKKEKSIYRQIVNHSCFVFDILDLRLGSGEHYMLTQVIVRPKSDGSEVTIKQKPKPYMAGTIGNSLNVQMYFGKIESAWELFKNQSYVNSPEQETRTKQ